jgi:hypothetical protein
MERLQYYVCLQRLSANTREMVEGAFVSSSQCSRSRSHHGAGDVCRVDWLAVSVGFSRGCNHCCSSNRTYTGSIRPHSNKVRFSPIASFLIDTRGLLLTNIPRLILTPTSHPKRSLTSQLRMLPSYLCPSLLIVPTILHSLITPAISHATPLLLRSRLAIDPLLTPNTYQLARFVSKSVELFIKLPLETVLRRGQIAVLQQETVMIREQGKWEGDLETMVKVGDYRGVVGTMWLIVREEGAREVPVIKGKGKLKVTQQQMKGQGLPGLWRGWRVGMWGLVGMWSSRMLSGGTVNGEEF